MILVLYIIAPLHGYEHLLIPRRHSAAHLPVSPHHPSAFSGQLAFPFSSVGMPGRSVKVFRSIGGRFLKLLG